MGIFLMLTVFIEGRHRHVQRLYEICDNLRIRSVEDRGKTTGWSEHPHRSGTAIVPWFQLLIPVSIADDLPVLHVFNLVKAPREQAG